MIGLNSYEKTYEGAHIMLLIKIILGIFNFIKRIYLWVFNFMIGKETKKFSRFFVHMMMVVLFVFFPYAYINAFVQLLTSEVEFTIERLFFMIVGVLVPVVLTCVVKLMMMSQEE